MCSKVSFSKRDAQSVLNRIVSRGYGQYRKEIRIYHCPECNQWHLTSHDNREGSRKIEEVDLAFFESWKKLINNI